MDVIINILIAVSLFVVLGILLVGLGGMVRGGEFNTKWGNKLMRWRVTAQAVAIGVLLVGFIYKANH